MSTVRLHNLVTHTTALGPGTRMVIWFQGCRRRCPGCMSPASRPLEGGTVWELEDLIETVCRTKDIEGITISGGEPFLQPEALYRLLKAVRQRTDLGVIIYTGNTMEELRRTGDPQILEIVDSLADLIIDGEYVDALNDGSSLKGSSNQTVHYITTRYLPHRELYEGKSRDIQIFISGKDAFLVGVPYRETLETWKEATRRMAEETEEPPGEIR